MSLTNFERIKLMTIEELAVLIDRIQDSEREDWLSIGCHNCCNYNTHHYPNDCKELDGSVCVDMGGALAWLKKCSLEDKNNDETSDVATNSYLTKANVILDKLNIKVNGINTKSDIQKSRDFNATLTPSLNKLVIK